MAGLHSGNSDFQVQRPFALGREELTKLETAALQKAYRGMAGAVEATNAARTFIPAPVQSVKLVIFRAPPTQAIDVAALESAAINSGSGQNNAMPLPARRPSAAAQILTQRNAAHAPATRVASADATASVPPAQPTSLTGGILQRFFAPRASHNETALLAAVDDHTALYDIEAHVVYLPNGERMEAHSGLGQWIDDPGHISMKARGATPPNVYNLTMREGLFHGVEALRLNPVGDNSMYGRDGILAHPYMLGPSGQSFGCVSFRDYEAFLRAFKRGEVNRIVVVTHVDGPLPASMRAGRDSTNHFAFN
jgi:hypothetical protein